MQAAFRTFVTALLFLGLVLPIGPAQADMPDAANWPRPRFITHNICGAAKQCPPVDRKAFQAAMVSAIDHWDADLVFLQEVCYGQWTLLRDHLNTRTDGPRYDSVWGATRTSSGCLDWGSDQRFGLATFAKGTFEEGTRTVVPLPEDESDGAIENRILLCGRVPVTGRPVRACNTHIAPETGQGGPQVDKVAEVTRSYAAEGDPVVLGGDFNLAPTDSILNALYDHNGGKGVFQEVDESDTAYFGPTCDQSADRCRSGEPTAVPTCATDLETPVKIDYIFLSYYWFTNVRGDAAACADTVSDHRLLRGAAAWEH
ncbi:endonuclease/exonuclease/phosphatase family protein [Nonomuraea muscovyensis]